MNHFFKYLDSRPTVHEGTKIQTSDTKYMTYPRWLQIICHKYENIKTDFLQMYVRYFSWVLEEVKMKVIYIMYEGWNFNFGNTPLDWIQDLLE